ncbi:MAG: hypothetical protein ABFD18_18625 [Syntrophomonas sp.]
MLQYVRRLVATPPVWNEKCAPLLSYAATASGIGAMISSSFTNAIAASSGSFNLPLILGSVMFALGIVITAYLTSPKTQRKIRQLDEIYAKGV